MNLRSLRLVHPLLLATLAVACSSSSSATSPGDASTTDGGHTEPGTDGGTTKPHGDSGGGTTKDGGSGMKKDGGGTPGHDGSTSSDDSGASDDSGGANDAGDSGTTSQPDTGTPEGDAGTVGGVPGGVAGPGTTLSGCQIFPADNPWNVRVDGPSVQTVSTYTKLPQGTALHADFGDFSPDGYGIPYAVVQASAPNEQVKFGCFADESDPGPAGWTTSPMASSADCMGEGGGTELGVTAYPFFNGMKIEGNPATGSGGTPGALPNDQHALILQVGSSGCTAWEAWNCVESNAPFNCANGAKFDLTSNTLRPLGWTSADAAGLSILAGLVRLADVKAGVIHHAIRVTFNDTQAGYILPATHASGSEAVGSGYAPMGLRLRLKSSVVITSYPAPAQVVLKAMQEYGLIIADIGSNWYFQGDSDNGWNDTATDGADTWFDEITDGTNDIHGSDFEVVYTGPVITTGL